MAFKWKDEYSCNIEEIDQQHKKLFEIGTRVYDAVSIKDGVDRYDEIMDILNELKEYTVYHFNYEEQLMKNHNYGDYDEHKIEHDFFIKKVERIGRKDVDKAQEDALMEIISFVADWISSHILKRDMKYKAFFNSQGVY